MNHWIKIQKIIMFIPVANLVIFPFNEIYYKRICKDSELSFKVCSSCIFGILLIGMPVAFLLSYIFDQYPFWEELKGKLFQYWIPLTMNYAMLRTQCKRLNVKPDEIGPGFYKFLLLRENKEPSTSAKVTDESQEVSDESTSPDSSDKMNE